MNFEDCGMPIAKVSFEGNKKKDRVLCVGKDDPNVETEFVELKLQKPKETVQVIPNKKRS